MRISDWSSDVCSSDLEQHLIPLLDRTVQFDIARMDQHGLPAALAQAQRAVGRKAIEQALDALFGDAQRSSHGMPPRQPRADDAPYALNTGSASLSESICPYVYNSVVSVTVT